MTSGETAELNIGLMCTIGPRVLAGMLDDFQMQHPKVSFVLHDVTPASIPDLLLSGGLDGAFSARHTPPDPQMRYIDLFEEAMVVAFPHGHEFSKVESVSLLSIARQRYVERLHCEFRTEVIEFYQSRDLQLEVSFRSQREDWIQSLVHDGMAVSVMPRYSLLQPELDHRPIIDPPLTRRVEFVVAESKADTSALDSLAEFAGNYDWVLDE